MEVEIISKENVKPSSPTPHHLQIYNFSLLDQIAAPVFYPMVVYFLPEPDSNSSGKVDILRNSLSSHLVNFYPFAGIISDDYLSVKCNDEGIPFIIAKVRGTLQDFLSEPDPCVIIKFIPVDYISNQPRPGDHVSTIQVNCFECGGLAISIVVAHAVADGTTLATFLRGWAAAARSAGEEICPEFLGQNLFPPIKAMERGSKLYISQLANFSKFGKFVTRRYLFETSVIEKLKERATSSDSSATAKPTRVEVVLAFIWKCYMKLFTDKPTLEKPSLLSNQVDLRRRADPALPVESFGNFLWMMPTKCIMNPVEADFKDLVREVNRAIRKVDSEFVKVLQNNGYYEKFKETREGWLVKDANNLLASSWCKFGLYDLDFGWGKPIWLSGYVGGDSVTRFSDFVLLMDTRSGDGIEAWVFLEEKHVAAFEENEDLQNHVLINPSPLQVGKRNM
ncbi:vinorine synthase-like [Dorcoceras hygrometricum]|uniref:Vinorine synthase-like n=1 Tax=Dorcoceras hygrometricum TaxID=472368 RepID=A0A2Z7DEG1_9LAMI|nr:vinorine synthase-like [Dorcoceras hygrometricum]